MSNATEQLSILLLVCDFLGDWSAPLLAVLASCLMRWPDVFILSRTLKFKLDHEPVQQGMSSAASSYPGVLTEPGKGAPKNDNRIRGPRRKHSCPPGALVLSTEETDVPSSTRWNVASSK